MFRTKLRSAFRLHSFNRFSSGVPKTFPEGITTVSCSCVQWLFSSARIIKSGGKCHTSHNIIKRFILFIYSLLWLRWSLLTRDPLSIVSKMLERCFVRLILHLSHCPFVYQDLSSVDVMCFHRWEKLGLYIYTMFWTRSRGFTTRPMGIGGMSFIRSDV